MAACGARPAGEPGAADRCDYRGHVLVELDAHSTDVAIVRGDPTHVWMAANGDDGVQLLHINLGHTAGSGAGAIVRRLRVADEQWRVAALAEDGGSLLVGLRSRHGNLALVRAVFLGAVGDLGASALLSGPPDAHVELDVAFRDGVPVALLGINGESQARLLVSTAAVDLELPGSLLGAPQWDVHDDVFVVTVVEHGVERWVQVKPDGTIESRNMRRGEGMLLDCGDTGWTPAASLPSERRGLLACTRTVDGATRIRLVEARCSLHEHHLHEDF